jgi:hypothetical protein
MSQNDKSSVLDEETKLLEEWVNQSLSEKTNFESAPCARSAGTGTVCCCSQNTCGD